MKAHGLTFFTGVPCSLLKSIIEHAQADEELLYLPAVREDAALALASGAALGGKRTGILCQNSGLGHMVNPLTSLNLIYKIPVFLLITWRGEGGKDAPEHLVMGKITQQLLQLMKIPSWVIEEERFPEQVALCLDVMEKESIPAALILRKGVVE